MDERTTSKAGHLVDLLEQYGSIVRLQDRLRTLLGRLEQAQAYLAKPGGNLRLGRAQYERLRAQCLDVVGDLRDARRAAHVWLGLAETAA